jgi:hypothetical protein
MNYLIGKLKGMFSAFDRRLTAIALADVGDFDGVQNILQGRASDNPNPLNNKAEAVMTKESLSHGPIVAVGQR